MSAYFNMQEKDISVLRKKGYDDDSIIKILIIQTGSYLTMDEVLNNVPLTFVFVPLSISCNTTSPAIFFWCF